jgi:HD superfamily phosphohydrolase
MALRSIDSFDKQEKARVQRFLPRHKVIRDPIHGDLYLSELEIRVVDTPEFQRLRRIRQLGTSFLVYPGAQHTRFEHSLGTMHVAARMVEALNANPFSDAAITTPEEIQLIRLTALLHDLAHVPFGHTLEDEANLFPSQWDAPGRSPESLVGASTSIGQMVEEHLGKPALLELIQILAAKDYPSPSGNNAPLVRDLPRPYIADIVGNTVCADLLDYLERDIYFCGLREAYDERFLNYLVLTKDAGSGKLRVAIRLVGAKGRVRRDNVSEILHLLRLRYSLAEKVYFHHAKISSSAMISEAVRRSTALIANDLPKLSDDGLVELLRRSGSPAAKLILQRLDQHSLYEEVYGHSYLPPTIANDPQAARRPEVAQLYRSPSERASLQADLEAWNSLPEGSIIVYCPPYEMGLKEARVRVVWKEGKVTELKDVPDDHIKSEVTAIQENHRRLWRVSVLVDRFSLQGTTGTELGKGIAFDAQGKIGLPNQVDRYLGESRPWSTRAVHRLAKEWDALHPDSPVTLAEATSIGNQVVVAWDPQSDPNRLRFPQFAERLAALRQARVGSR